MSAERDEREPIEAPDRPIADITPSARTAVRTEAARSQEPETGPSQEPEAARSQEPEAARSQEPETAPSQEPETAPSQEPGPDTDAAPDAGPHADAGHEAGTARPETKADTDTTTTTDTDEAETTTDGEAGPDDKWEAFGPAPEVAPGRLDVVRARFGEPALRVLGHEWFLAGVGAILLAIFMTWPALREPTRTVPQDVGDPTLQTWVLAWGGHAVANQPDRLWEANAFYPETYGFAFTDSLLGYAPFGLIGSGVGAALLRYNLVYVFAFALAFFGAYALVRQLGARPAGALVAGAAFAYAPWRLSQAGHLHVLSSGGIALAMAMLARGHGWSLREGYRPAAVRPLWAVGGWLVAAWQVSLGFGIGLPFGYFLAGVCLVGGTAWGVRLYRRRTGVPWRLVLAHVGGGLAFVAVCAAMAYPYLKVADQHPQAKRTAEYVGQFSPPWEGLFIPPETSWLWGEKYAEARAQLDWAAEMTLLPGFFLIGLAVAGLFVSIWTVRQRVLLAGGVVVSAALALGPNGPGEGKYGYFFLYDVLPGFDAIRTSGRLVIYTILFLGVLAAGAVTAFGGHARESTAERTVGPPSGWLRAAMIVPFVLVLLEGVNSIPHVIVSQPPVSFASIEGPALVLPTDEITDGTVMVWSTDGFPKIVNGNSGVWPPTQQRVREVTKRFPDEESVRLLRDLKIRTVLVVRSRAVGGDYARAIDAPIDGLGLTRTEEGDAIIYTLDSAP